MYPAYQAQADLLWPLRTLNRLTLPLLDQPGLDAFPWLPTRPWRAAGKVFDLARRLQPGLTLEDMRNIMQKLMRTPVFEELNKRSLLGRIIRACSNPGETVLDPFAGSGSTLVAAHLEGFHAVGIEREADYVNIARRRIDEATRQKDLFIEPTSPPPQKQESMF